MRTSSTKQTLACTIYLGKGSISLIYSKRSISKEYRAEGMATMLKEAFASPIVKSLLQDAFYVVNFGLWHAVCTTDNNPMVFKFANQGEGQRVVQRPTQYQWRLTQLFEQLLKSTRRPILWRDTTAVHPSRRENVNKETREKYKQQQCCDRLAQCERHAADCVQPAIRRPHTSRVRRMLVLRGHARSRRRHAAYGYAAL